MLLNSMLFIWLFLPVSIVLYYLSDQKYKKLILAFFSIFFWFFNDPKLMPVLFLFSFITYFIGIWMEKSAQKKKMLLTAGIVINLMVLCLYKYIVSPMPVAISFVSFSLISYLVDIYQQKAPAQKNIVSYILYIAFFPKLLMGPIELYRNFSAELESNKTEYNDALFGNGLTKFISGFAKKVLIADMLAPAANKVFMQGASLSTGAAWLGVFAYTLQIYFDFSGYSDMAIGTAEMFGYHLHDNFHYPYLSVSLTDFWRRWHISLGTWFKNYLYFPLGGSRKGKFRTYINLFIVFLATGIWHGSGLTFVIWGIYNGIIVVLERMFLLPRIKDSKVKVLWNLYALVVIAFGWIIFRSNDLNQFFHIINVMFSNTSGELTVASLMNKRILIAFITGVLGCGYIQLLFSRIGIHKLSENIIFRIIVLVILFGLSVLATVNSTFSAFIYAQF